MKSPRFKYCRFFQAQIVRGELAFESFRSAIYIFLFPKYIVNEQKFGAPIFWLTSLKSTDLPSFPRKTEHHNLPACFPKPKKSPNPRSLQSRKCMLSSPALWSASEGLADGWDWKAWRWWDWLVSFKQQIDGFFRTSFGVYIVFLGCALVPSLFR